MSEGEQSNGSGVGIGIVVWLAVFAASWVTIAAMTSSNGLALVWGVFIALLGFELSRVSFSRALFIILLSLFVLMLHGVYSMFF